MIVVFFITISCVNDEFHLESVANVLFYTQVNIFFLKDYYSKCRMRFATA